jgi:glycosyltransferase involved in cell wall biosynthesis
MRSNNPDSSKIVFVIRYFHPFIGGLEKKTLNLASALVERGVAVEVVTSRFSAAWPARDNIKNVPVCRLFSPRIKILGGMIFLVLLCWHLVKNRFRMHIIHAFQVGYSSAAAILVGTLLSKPTILNISSSGTGGDVNRHRKTPWGWLFLRCCRFVSRIVILNQEMYAEIKGLAYPEKAIVKIPNGVDLTTYRIIDKRHYWREKIGLQNEKLILYTGRLSAEKGVDVLIAAYAALDKSLPTKLYILGDGPETARLKQLIRHYHMEDRVLMQPAVDDVAGYLFSADIFVMPSYFEGLSNSVLEAMACGIPVIATRVTGNKELVTDGINGLLVEPRNTAQLTEALSYLIKNPDKGSELCRRAHELVKEHYDLYTVADKYINLYQDLQ